MSGTGLSAVTLTGWGLVALGGVLFLTLVGRAIRGLWRRFRPLNVWARYAEESSPFRRRRRAVMVWFGSLILLVLSLITAAAGLLLLYLQDAGQAYAPFPVDNIAARVQCRPAPGAPSEMMACSLDLNSPVYSETVTLQGVRWGLEGEMLVWDSALERFGLNSGYRLLHLLGYDAVGQVAADVAIPASQAGLRDDVMRWINYLPIVRGERRVVGGEALEETFYELSVSRTGFILREWGPTQP